MMGYNPSKQLKFITKRGIQLGYDSVLSRYKRYYSSREKMGQLSFDNLDFERLSNEPEIFQVTGNWQITGADSSGGNFSLLFKKIEKDWKIIVDHTW
jgi:ketosteroid isomerase-like protein